MSKANLALAGKIYNPGYTPTPKGLRWGKVIKITIIALYLLSVVRSAVSVISRYDFINANAKALIATASTQADSFTLIGLEDTLILGLLEIIAWTVLPVAAFLYLMSDRGKRSFVGLQQAFVLSAAAALLSFGFIADAITTTNGNYARSVIYKAIDLKETSRTSDTIVGTVNGKLVTVNYSPEDLSIHLTPEVREAIEFSQTKVDKSS